MPLESLASTDGAVLSAHVVAKATELMRAAGEATRWSGFRIETPRKLRAVAFASPEHTRLDALAMAGPMSKTAFVLVAGGLGERLGLPRSIIKLALPYESIAGWSFLELFLSHLASYRPPNQKQRMELAIMTSDDTHDATEALLRTNARAQSLTAYGAAPGAHHDDAPVHVTLLKQPAVPAIADAAGRLAKESPFRVLEKPHGHGDVHTMLHRSGLVKAWISAGLVHVAVFQDTNPGAFLALPALVAACVEDDLEAGVIVIPRLAKSASGSIVRLIPPSRTSSASTADVEGTNDSKRACVEAGPHTANVEYNVLSAVLRGALQRDDENDPHTGFSPFPGNTNQLVFRLAEYDARLEAAPHNGRLVPDFINPKFAPDGVTFSKPTRLESLMQDYLALVPEDKVGVVLVQDWHASEEEDATKAAVAHSVYAPAKNSLDAAVKLSRAGASDGSAASSEMAVYRAWAGVMRLVVGASAVQGPTPTSLVPGLSLAQWPRILFRPSFAPSISALVRRGAEAFPTPSSVRISSRSVFVVDGPGTVVVEDLDLDGALVVHAAHASSRIILRRVRERNAGIAFVASGPDTSDPVAAARGFRAAPDSTVRRIVASRSGEVLVVVDPAAAA